MTPYLLIAVFLLCAMVCAALLAVLAHRRWRKDNPTLATQRKELDRALTMEEITYEEYADRSIKLEAQMQRRK